jgi:hypothetical protein
MKNILFKILKIIGWILVVVLGLAAILFIYFNFPVGSSDQKADLGVTFSHRYAKDLGLDWKEVYAAMLDDLKIRKIRIPVYWDLVEAEKGKYDFADVDWQIAEAEKRGAKVILVVGQKVPRWPECFIPKWASNDNERKSSLLKMINRTVARYQNNPTIERWQVENEPFLGFGICPALDKKLLDTEIGIVRLKDSTRPIVITDSGELSLWVQAASRADIFGTTMYLDIWSTKMGYSRYPIGPRFFHFKQWLISTFANQEKAIVIELQGEPWMAGWVMDFTPEQQLQKFNAEKLRENIEFAKKADFPEIYVWGVEWWYWLKTKAGNSSVWDEARILFRVD